MSYFPRLLSLALLASASTQARAGEFETTDSNHDGRVSSGEHEGYVRAAFDRMDGNGDDKLTQAEMDAAGKAFWRHVDAGGTPRGAAPPPTTAEKLQRLDANQDGLISQGEYANAGAAKFQTIDKNHNGELSFEEFWAGF